MIVKRDVAVSHFCAAVNFSRMLYYLCLTNQNNMGKIKEAMILQEEIIEHIEEKIGEGTAQEFNILEYCFKNDLTPQQARDHIFSASTVELQKLVE